MLNKKLIRKPTKCMTECVSPKEKGFYSYCEHADKVHFYSACHMAVPRDMGHYSIRGLKNENLE